MNGEYVSFILGGVDYCVPVESVRQVLSKENVLDTPKAHPFIRGVISLRGDVVPVIDMRARIGLPPESTWRKRRIIVVEYGRSSYGLLVDEVRDIVELDAVDESAASPSELIQASGRSAERSLRVLDLSRVFSAEKPGAGRAERGEAPPEGI